MKQTKRLWAALLTLVLTLSLTAVPVSAEGGYSDTRGHWAESAIERWSGYDIVSGDSGAFRPDESMTRAQLAKVLANMLGLTESSQDGTFSDVPASAWYAPYMLRCHAAGIVRGADGKGNPDAPVSRQEAMTMIARALDIAPVDTAALDGYRDADAVAPWAAGYVAALKAAGIVGGVSRATLAPTVDINRASVMTVFDKAVAQYINAPGAYTLTDKSGIVLVAAGDVTLTGATRADVLVSPAADGKAVSFDKATVTGKVVVQADGAKVTASADSTLPAPSMTGTGSTYAKAEAPKQTTTRSSSGGSSHRSSSTPTPVEPDPKPAQTISTASSDLSVSALPAGTYAAVTIDSGVGNGNVMLKDVEITGNLTISGGGSNSITLDGCTIGGKVIFDKASGDAPRMHLKGSSKVEAVEVKGIAGAIIEADSGASPIKTVEASKKVEIKGSSTTVSQITVPSTVEAPVEIKVSGGTVTKVAAEGNTTVSGTSGTVATVEAKAPVTVAAAVVEKVEIPATVTEANAVKVEVTGTDTQEAVQIDNKTEATVTIESEGAEVTKADNSKDFTRHVHIWGEGVVDKTSGHYVIKFTCTVPNCSETKTEEITAQWTSDSKPSWTLPASLSGNKAPAKLGIWIEVNDNTDGASRSNVKAVATLAEAKTAFTTALETLHAKDTLQDKTYEYRFRIGPLEDSATGASSSGEDYSKFSTWLPLDPIQPGTEGQGGSSGTEGQGGSSGTEGEGGSSGTEGEGGSSGTDTPTTDENLADAPTVEWLSEAKEINAYQFKVGDAILTNIPDDQTRYTAKVYDAAEGGNMVDDISDGFEGNPSLIKLNLGWFAESNSVYQVGNTYRLEICYSSKDGTATSKTGKYTFTFLAGSIADPYECPTNVEWKDGKPSWTLPSDITNANNAKIIIQFQYTGGPEGNLTGKRSCVISTDDSGIDRAIERLLELKNGRNGNPGGGDNADYSFRVRLVSSRGLYDHSPSVWSGWSETIKGSSIASSASQSSTSQPSN